MFAQSEPRLGKLMIDTIKPLNFGYELIQYVNINRLVSVNSRLFSDRQCL